MRLIQFRRHLTGFSVRVSDSQDIIALSGTTDLARLVSISELPAGAAPAKLLSVEFYGAPPTVTDLSEWKTYVWGILKYRKRPARRRC